MDKKNYNLEFIIKWVDEFDINTIPLTTRKEWYRSYTRAYLSNLDADYEEPSKYLKESEQDNTDIEVKPIKEVIERLIATYNMTQEQFVVTNFNGVSAAKVYDIPAFLIESFGVIIPNEMINISIIDQEMKKDGYYRVRTSIKRDNSNMEWYVLGYNPIKQPDIYDSVKYFHWLHFSPSIYREEIQKNGLKLSEGNDFFKYFEARVYFYIFDLKYQISEEFKRVMHNKSKRIKKEHPEWDGTYDIFEIIKSKVPKNLEMFYDPNVSSSVYTKKAISKNALKLKKTGVTF